MTDRELTELAAKAAGYWNKEFDCFQGPMDFDPLNDDEDAFRLAVALRITPHIDDHMTDCEGCTEAHFGNPYAATRRAIVRAAAEIGKAMK